MKRRDMTTSDLIIVKQTLRLMLNNKKHFDQGLCLWLMHTWGHTSLSSEDRDIAGKYIKANRPFRTKIRFIHSAFWWGSGNIAPRIKWIKKHISLIEKELINRRRPI